MNGAEAVIAAASEAGIEICFANPGTTEVHLVGALDRTPSIRPILGLFEGVCTGAADGYARMASRPAMTMLHLGPGLGNGIANLHNAKQAGVPLINLVGTHATNHLNNKSPMASDIPALARTVSGFVRETRTSTDAARDFLDAFTRAVEQNLVATLILPADSQWNEAVASMVPVTSPRAAAFDPARLDAAAAALKGGQAAALIVGGSGLRERGLREAGRIHQATRCRILSKRQPARIESGPRLLPIERLGYFPEHFTAQVGDISEFVLAGTEAPAAIFAYRDGPTHVIPEGRKVHILADTGDDIPAALEALADRLSAPESGAVTWPGPRPELPPQDLNPANVGQALASIIPDEAIVVDESITSAPDFFERAVGRFPMSYLSLTGGAIGGAGPLAVGAAVACPGRPVVVVQGDGSAMYTLQALWTQARERLSVTTIICANRRYAILGAEQQRAGVDTFSAPVSAMMDLADPALDWISLAGGMGVPAERASSGTQLAQSLARAVREGGPHLIELPVPSSLHQRQDCH